MKRQKLVVEISAELVRGIGELVGPEDGMSSSKRLSGMR